MPFDSTPYMPYLVYMLSREELEQIVDRETPDANAGCVRAQSLVINAQAELDDHDRFELAIRLNQQIEEEETA